MFLKSIDFGAATNLRVSPLLPNFLFYSNITYIDFHTYFEKNILVKM